MKKSFFMLIAIAAIAVSTLTSCGKDETVTPTPEPEVICDTVTKLVCPVDYADICKLVDYYTHLGENLQSTLEYEEFVSTHILRPVQSYLIWIAYADKQDRTRFFSYTIHADERAYVQNRQELATFENDVVTPIREYVANLKDQGYGTISHTTWFDPDSFLEESLIKYQGDDPYGYSIMLAAIASRNYLFGAKK